MNVKIKKKSEYLRIGDKEEKNFNQRLQKVTECDECGMSGRKT